MGVLKVGKLEHEKIAKADSEVPVNRASNLVLTDTLTVGLRLRFTLREFRMKAEAADSTASQVSQMHLVRMTIL